MKKSKKKIIWWSSGSAAAVVIIILILVAAFGKPQGTFVEVEKAQKAKELISIVTASGEIMPKEYVDIQSEIVGVITDLYVKEGDRVSKGDILLKVDPVQTEADVRAASFQMKSSEDDASNTKNQIEQAKLNIQINEATLERAKADVKKMKATLARDEMSFKRQQELHEANLISREDYDLAKATYEISESNLVSAQAYVDQLNTQMKIDNINIQRMEQNYQSAMNRVKQLKAILERQQDLLKKTIITSPLNGVITKLDVERGERAVPGTLNNPSATLMTIADLSVIEAEVKVDETDIINVHLDQPVTVKVDALPDQPLKGVVTEIGNSAINAGLSTGGTEEAKDFKVVVQLTNPPDTLRPGLSATAEITTAKKADVLAIPLQALVMREVELNDQGAVIHPWEKKRSTGSTAKTQKKEEPKKVEKQGVFVVDKTNRAVFTPVTTGITGEIKIQITSGLKEGDEVVVGSFKTLRTLKDGQTIIKRRATTTKS